MRIAGIVGVYSWKGLRSAGDVVYLGEVIGGAPRRSLEFLGGAHARTGRSCRAPCSPGSGSASATRWTSRPVATPVHRVQPVTIRHVLGFATAWLHTPFDRLRGRR